MVEGLDTSRFERPGEGRDSEWFDDAVRKHDHELRLFCRRFAVDSDECEDMVQDAWAVAWECRQQYRGSGTLPGWLKRLARTVCLRAVRSRRATVEVSTVPLTAAIPPSVEAALRAQSLDEERLSRILALPPRRRAIVLARVLEGMSTRETAEFVGCRPGTVKAALHRAIQDLRKADLVL
jgi:RNA polymerase sigma-70 factor, ECF subfamily